MRAVVTFESIYGNTRAVAEAIGEGLRSAGEVAVVSQHELDPAVLAGAELVVVGAPTHMHGLPTSMSRKMGAHGARRRASSSIPAPRPAQASGAGSRSSRGADLAPRPSTRAPTGARR